MLRFNTMLCAAGFLSTTLLSVNGASIPSRSISSTSCPELNGTFFIDQPGLYPENVDFDPNSCRLYIRYDTHFHQDAATQTQLTMP